MRENHYYGGALSFVADLINRPLQDGNDLVARWLDRELGVELTVTDADVEAVRRLVDDWVAVVDAQDDGVRAALINAMLAASSTHPRMTDHDGTGWHLHYRDDRAAVADVMRATTAVAMAKHLAENGMHRFGRCTTRDCRAVYVDVTRGGAQRYCTRACANRDAVRRHRSRARGGTQILVAEGAVPEGAVPEGP